MKTKCKIPVHIQHEKKTQLHEEKKMLVHEGNLVGVCLATKGTDTGLM